jgi:protease-4
MGEYYLATACDKVILHPSGSLDIKGVAYATTFFKGLLDKLGIRPQFVAIGKYKSAPETYTRRDFSEPAKEEIKELVDAQYEQLVAGIASARRLSQDEVKTLVTRGLFSPPLAKEKGLVDAVAYPDEVPGLFAKGPAQTYPLNVYKPASWAHPDILAVVTIDGAITRGESGGDLINGASSGSATVTRALRELRKEDRVKAVVIRVDSPGGDATASDEIGREIDLLRQAGKPVVISMGNVAASGGYWVAANGTRIYAEPGTITGSIGVFTGSFSYNKLLDKLGVSTQTIKRGEHADMETGFRPMSDEELNLLRENARYTYVQFLERVAKGRKMATSRVDEIAQGRVWAGSRALDVGLVDKLGGLELAIEDARQEAKLERDTMTLEFLPKPGSLWETLDDSTMDAKIKNTIKAAEEYQRVKSWLLMPPIEPTTGR